jgi:hypothetical protein
MATLTIPDDLLQEIEAAARLGQQSVEQYLRHTLALGQLIPPWTEMELEMLALGLLAAPDPIVEPLVPIDEEALFAALSQGPSLVEALFEDRAEGY